MTPAIAIVGMACRYPDARSPTELWENVLAQRRAFRTMPPERVRLEDYFSDDSDEPDRTYSMEAALIEGYEFDRVRFRVAGTTFRSADLAHWLALDIAAQALDDAGFPDGDGLPRETTGVILGNTLTGEFSRANVLRLRWPYVRRVIEAALIDKGWSLDERRGFLGTLEERYKAPFPPVGDETLAGSLSNTIAGRICNHFDLKGGGYTVDGACAASLLAITTACSSLAAGDLDVAIAGGVDLSLDPFELVGFAKVGALAVTEMRIYDVRSAGFWPGEGAGCVVLMRHDEAMARGRRIYALIRGWGVSSDGSGGITRPEAAGQLLAVRRAYQRAGCGIETVGYFEGHGTGTSVGDSTEIAVLSHARRQSAPDAPSAIIGSIKANIGHTKAAAGVAGLIKATMALHTRLLPPTTGCDQPYPELTGEQPALRVLSEAEPWPDDRPLRASVSAMGFGGINTHVVLDGTPGSRGIRSSAVMAPPRGARVLPFATCAQDTELFLLVAQDSERLNEQVAHLLAFAAKLSRAELTDLAAQLQRTLGDGHVRAAVVAASPRELASRLETLQRWVAEGMTTRLDPGLGLFYSSRQKRPRIGLLFPGQGSPSNLTGGAWCLRFDFVRDLYAQANLPTNGDGRATLVAQPAILTASLAGLRALEHFGIQADVAVGHSLGELTAYHWAGALDEPALLRIAAARGRAMTDLGSSTGTMASIAAGRLEVEELLDGEPVVVAGLNSPRQTVVSGEAAVVAKVVSRARARGLNAADLPVSHAFHSPLVAAAAPALAQQLARENFGPLERPVVSTVTGSPLAAQDDLRALLCRQVTSPVRFIEAVTAAVNGDDLFIEVGPGHVLSGLVADMFDVPAVALDAGGRSVGGLLHAVGAAFALGAAVRHEALFADRFTRPFNLDWRPRFFVNPCELAPLPVDDRTLPTAEPTLRADSQSNELDSSPIVTSQSAIAIVRQLVSDRAELPISAVRDDDRLLGDLHLSSIAVSQLAAEAARRLGLRPPVSPTDFANATVAEVARALDELVSCGGSSSAAESERVPAGVDSWVRTFQIELVESPLGVRQPSHDRTQARSASEERNRSLAGASGLCRQPAHDRTQARSASEERNRSLAGASGLCARASVGDELHRWQIIAPPDYRLHDPLKNALAESPRGGGIVLCLPPNPDERHVHLMLEAAKATLVRRAPRFVLVQHGGGGAAFARTLHLEATDLITCVVDVPLGHPSAAEWVRSEVEAATGYSESHYDSAGTRREPRLRLLPQIQAADSPLSPADVLLVTGGGKGIAAECALAIARETGVRLVLMGRSEPQGDSELSGNLDRMAALGIQVRYVTADVTDRNAVERAIRAAEIEFGPITALLHGAGTNVPQLLSALDESAFLRTLRPKVDGAKNVLAAIDPKQLRLLVTFGSIIARTGMRGEADYAVANEWLTMLVEQFQREHPNCRCLAVEWSVWSGVGMGQRLGRIDVLVQQGITPISTDEGVGILCRLIGQPSPASVVVTGRFGDPPTLKLDRPELPFLRFLEQPRVYYPGVELVVDAEMSLDTDPYLNDHVFRGDRLFPAVMGLEAMAQAAMAVTGTSERPVFEQVQFTRAVSVAEKSSVKIRLAALVREPGRVDVVLRSEETAFQVDHFRATCRFEPPAVFPPHAAIAELPRVDIDPARDLYGGLLFQGGRFRRLRGYRLLKATECIAEIAPAAETNWFGRYLPAELILGDPAARDATLHAIQACIPHAFVLPVAVDRVVPGVAATDGPLFVRARERSRAEQSFVYDVEVTDANGRVRERWEGLRLQVAEQLRLRDPLPAILLGPYVERRLDELLPDAVVEVIVEHGKLDRHARGNRAVQRALGSSVSVSKRPDGKPQAPAEFGLSTAHAGNLTLAVAGRPPIGCDVESIVQRFPANWCALLGVERFTLAEVVAREAKEDQDTAATRVWTALECLKKAGAAVDAPLVFLASTADAWVLLRAGPLVTATVAIDVREADKRLVLAVLVRSDEWRSELTNSDTLSRSKRRTSSATSTT